MLETVLGDYLDNIEQERDYDAPFLALLGAMGFRDVHLTHGTIEKGKDFIGKSQDGQVQWVFQTKRGNVGVGDLNNGIMGQLQAAAMSGLGHPAFDKDLPRQIVLVVTGKVTQPANDQIESFSNDGLAKLNHPRMLVWNRERLVEEFIKHGLGAVRVAQVTAQDIESQGRFYLLYGSALRDALDLEVAEEHSVSWLREDMDESRATLVGTIEASVISDACLRGASHYEAFFVQLSALRMIMARLHESGTSLRRDELVRLCEAQLETVLVTARIFCERALSAWEASGRKFDVAINSGAAIATYPVHCLRLCEALALLSLRDGEDRAQWASQMLYEFVSAEPGVGHPISDRYAVSSAIVVLALMKAGHLALAKKVLNNTTVWLCDRAEKGFGLAHVDATEQDEIDQLLGYAFPSLRLTKQDSSLLATGLAYMAAFAGDAGLYSDVVNDLRAAGVHPENFQALDTLGQFLIDHPDVIHTAGIDLMEELPQGDWLSHNPCVGDEPDSYTVSELVGSTHYLALMLFLRDRFFPRLWPKVVPGFALNP